MCANNATGLLAVPTNTVAPAFGDQAVCNAARSAPLSVSRSQRIPASILTRGCRWIDWAAYPATDDRWPRIAESASPADPFTVTLRYEMSARSRDRSIPERNWPGRFENVVMMDVSSEPPAVDVVMSRCDAS